jgi:ribonuclease T
MKVTDIFWIKDTLLNAFFDLGFLVAASNRAKLKSPFHQFSTIDTVSLSALYYGETVHQCH